MTLLASGIANQITGVAPELAQGADHKLTLAGRGLHWTLSRQNLPVIIPSNGTVAANGAITLTTALQVAHGPCWMYLPAGAVSGGAAGLYYCDMSSTTVGVVYTEYVANPNTGLSGLLQLEVPSVLVPAVGSGIAYTQVLTVQNLVLFRVPGGVLNRGNSLVMTFIWSIPNNANNKTISVRLNTTQTTTQTATASSTLRADIELFGRPRPGTTDVIAHYPSIANSYTSSTGGMVLVPQPLGDDFALGIAGQLAVATDYIVLENVRVTVLG